MIFDRKVNKLKVALTIIFIILISLFAYVFGDVFNYIEDRLVELRSSLSTDTSLYSHKFAPASEDIVIISVNDLTQYEAARSSELNLTRWPWSRAVWAKVINFIEQQNPKLVIVDLNFSNYEDLSLNQASPDMILANTLASYNNIILATALRTPFSSTNSVISTNILDNFDNPYEPVNSSLTVKIGNPEIENKISYYSHTPIPDIYTKYNTMAVTNLAVNNKLENVKYSQPLYKLVKGNKQYYIPSVPFAALLKLSGSEDEIPIENNILQLGKYKIRLNDNGQSLINWHGHGDSYTNIPINSILYSMVRNTKYFEYDDTKYPLSYLKDKIVIIAQTQLNTETHDTPVAKDMTDAEIKATIIDNYLNDSDTTNPHRRVFAKHLSIVKSVVLTLAFCLAIIFAITISTHLFLGFANGFLIILIYCGLSILIFLHPRYHILLYMAMPLYFMLATLGLSFLLKAHHEYKKRRKIEKIFGNLVSEKVLKQLTDKPHRLNLKSTVQQVTVMSCNIYNNVQISEDVSPEAYVELINKVFNTIEDIIFKYNGTINRFVGNSVLVYWGYPIHSRKDTENAVKAAIEIQEALQEFNETYLNSLTADEADETTHEKPKFYVCVKIAINTGNALIGQIGSKNVSDFTLLGETVDINEKIEGICSEFGKNIVLTESALKYLDVEPQTEYIGRLRLKDSEATIKIYELIKFNQESDFEIND